jgi:hypothetical protein
MSLNWREDPQRQSYDRGTIASKIGMEGAIPLTHLRPPMNYRKIGENDNAIRTKAPQALAFKIGHNDNLYTFRQRENSLNNTQMEISLNFKE